MEHVQGMQYEFEMPYLAHVRMLITWQLSPVQVCLKITLLKVFQLNLKRRLSRTDAVRVRYDGQQVPHIIRLNLKENLVATSEVNLTMSHFRGTFIQIHQIPVMFNKHLVALIRTRKQQRQIVIVVFWNFTVWLLVTLTRWSYIQRFIIGNVYTLAGTNPRGDNSFRAILRPGVLLNIYLLSLVIGTMESRS